MSSFREKNCIKKYFYHFNQGSYLKIHAFFADFETFTIHKNITPYILVLWLYRIHEKLAL